MFFLYAGFSQNIRRNGRLYLIVPRGVHVRFCSTRPQGFAVRVQTYSVSPSSPI